MQVHATKDKASWILAYLTIWQGMLGLTEKELELTAALAERHLYLSASTTDEDIIAELLLSTGYRQELREKLSMSVNNLQNYLTKLQEKAVLLPRQGKWVLNPRLVPQESITFSFTVTDDHSR